MEANSLYLNLLEQAKDFNKNNSPNPLEQGNLFTVLNMENKEVTAHSAFLYFVFKPFKRADGLFDDFNLRLLVKILLEARNIDKDITEYRNTDIRREVSFEYGRPDFVVTADDDTFIIELKIWAGEQPEQLPRYQNYLIQQGADKDNIFFLTPFERKSQTGKDISVTNITLKNDIRRALITICDERRRAGYEKYATMVEQYVSIIDKLTLGEKYMTKADILKSKEDLQAVDILIENRKNCLKNLLKDFFFKLGTKLGMQIKADGLPVASCVPYEYGEKSIENYYSDGRYYPALIFEIERRALKDACELKQDVNLYLFIEISDNLYCGISPRKADSLSSVVQCKDAFLPYSSMLENVKGKKHTAVFIVWDYLHYNERKINFNIGKLNDSDSFLNMLENNVIDKISENAIADLVNQIKRLYKNFCNAIFKSD